MADPAVQLADTAHAGVVSVGTPLVALGVALLLLTIATAVIWYLITTMRSKD